MVLVLLLETFALWAFALFADETLLASDLSVDAYKNGLIAVIIGVNVVLNAWTAKKLKYQKFIVHGNECPLTFMAAYFFVPFRVFRGDPLLSCLFAGPRHVLR